MRASLRSAVPWIAAVAAAAVPIQSSASRQTRQPHSSAMEAAWRARQQRIDSAYFKWRANVTYPKGSMNFGPPELVRTNTPPVDVIHEDPDVMFWMDGVKMRYEHTQPDMFERPGADGPRYVSAFDGQTSIDLTSGGGREFPVAIIAAEQRYADLGNVHFLAIPLAFRALHPEVLNINLTELVVTSERSVVGGHECLVFIQEARLPEGALIYCVDPAAEYAVRRRTLLVRGRPFSQLDIDYSRDRDHGWIPSAWTARLFKRDGALASSADVVVTEYAINPPIDQSVFRLELAPGTWVTERSTGREYLVLEEGVRRYIAARDAGRSYQELLATSAHGDRNSASRRTHALGIALVGGAGMCVLIAYLLLRRSSFNRVKEP